jgi:hypothetical protein
MDNEQPTDRRAQIRPLRSVKADGTEYTHPDNVLNRLAYYQSVPESVRFAEVSRMPSEVQVYFIRNTDRNCREFWERLFRELSRRAARIIHESLRGLPPFDAADLSARVEDRVMKRILNPNPSRNSDLLEIRFAQVVEGEALDALRVYMRSPLGALRGQSSAQFDDDGDEIERPLEELLTSGPGPESNLLVFRDRKRRHQLLRIACRAVPDRRHLKAAILRWGYDWPITSSDRNQRSLTRQFGVSEAQMHRWLDGAMKTMREALANEPEMITAQLVRALKGEQ